MKKRIEIQELLRWAYRDELPKLWNAAQGPEAFGEGWAAVERYSELLAEIDAPRNRYGVVIDFTDLTQPHADALAVADAVQEMDCYDFSVPDGWNPLDDMTGLGVHGEAAVARALDIITITDAAGVRRLRKPISQLVMYRTIMGSPPEWEGEQPAVKPVKEFGAIKWFRRVFIPLNGNGFGGYEAEVDGFNTRKRMPYPDAYKKYYLDPDPQEAIIGRAEYELYHHALGQLVENLAGKLEKWLVMPTLLTARPWLGGLQDKRILPDLRRRG